jgi:hypothetical protein
VPGVSLARTFERGDGSLREAIWLDHAGNGPLRQADGKIVPAIGTRPFPGPRADSAINEGNIQPTWQLGNLANDRAEQHELASRCAERVARMAQLGFPSPDPRIRDAKTIDSPASPFVPDTEVLRYWRLDHS